MSSTSKQSEDDLLAEEDGDKGEEDKESLTDERNAVLPRTSQQLKNQTAASSEEINLLTNAILGLTKSLPDLLNPPCEETKGKGKQLASKSSNTVLAKKAKDKDGEAGSSTSTSHQSTDCEILYDYVLNSKNHELEQNTTRSGDEDDFLSELVKEYESEKVAKLVDKMFRCKLSEKNLKDWLERQERLANCTTAKPPRVKPGIWH